MIIKKTFILLSILLSSTMFSFTQVQSDISLKLTSNPLERFQLENRVHFRSAYSLVFSVSGGSEITSSNTKIPVYEDSLFSYSTSRMKRSNVSLKAGIQRKLGLPKSAFFYTGSSLGVGFVNGYGWSSEGSYIIDSVVNYPPQTYSHDIYFTETFDSNQSIRTEIALNFGLDAPLSKRFSINAEIGLTGGYQYILRGTPHFHSFFSVSGYISGGLRYSFGKRHKGTPGYPS